jgi:tRNA/rRNA methyltransferase
MTPTILLIRPQMGENIGAAARAMANFGLKELRLVSPRDGWPNPKASDTAGRALNIIDDASLHETVAEALADCQFVLATTARERAMSLPVLDVREAMAELHTRAARGEKCAVLFGPERTGLENEDMALADAVVTIPTAPEYPSLNIGQAVVVCAYEWFMSASGATSSTSPPAGEATRLSEHRELSRSLSAEAHRAKGDGEGDHEQASPRPHPYVQPNAKKHLGTSGLSQGRGAPAPPLAPKSHLLGLFDQLEAALDDANFWRVPEKKDVMWRNIRASLVRAGLSEQEIATWRGVVKALKAP